MRKRRALRTELSRRPTVIDVRIALLGGSTTSELRDFLVLFLLDNGIRPVFYESQYNKYEEDVLVHDGLLRSFASQIAVVHTEKRSENCAGRLLTSRQYSYPRRYFPGAKTYNLTTALAIPSVIEKHVEWLVKNIPNLSHVIVELDWLSEYRPHDPAYAMLTEFHPDISGRSRYSFLLDFLATINYEGLIDKIDTNTGGYNPAKYKHDMNKGYWSRPLSDKTIDANCDEHVSFIHGNNPRIKINLAVLTNTLATIARVKSLLDQKKVKLTVFLEPRNHLQLDNIEVSDYELFVTQLVKITDFTNFMYYNKVTKNNCNYYDPAHPRPHVGELVVRSLAEQPNRQSDVYHYVSKESVISEVEYIKANFISERSSGL